MSSDTTDDLAEASPGNPRILLLLDDDSNRRLLEGWLSEMGYDVVPPDPDAADPPAFDLCIADDPGLARRGELVTAYRREHSLTFVPCLLVTDDRHRLSPRDELPVAVDGILDTPVRKRELKDRVESLLRARSLSLELEERKSQYQRLLGLAPEAIFLVREGRIVFLNQVARGLLAGPPHENRVDEFEGQSFVESVVPDDREAVENLIASLQAGEPPPSLFETRVRPASGEDVEVELTGVRIPYEGGTAIQLVVRNTSERNRRERQIRLYGRALDETAVGITIADVTQPDNPLIYANEAFERITGYEVSEVLGRNCRFLQGEGTDPTKVEDVRRALEEERLASVVLENYRKDGSAFWNELELTPVQNENDEVTHFLGFQRDVTERIEREGQLRSLYDGTRRLMAAETPDEICAIATEVADETLDLPACGVFLYDEDRDSLVPREASDSAIELFGTIPTFGRGEGIVWEVYEDGDPLVVDDIRNHPGTYNPDTPVRSELFVPLGNHGILISGATEPRAFDETDVRFAEMLAMNVETALDRARRERELRERALELERYETMVQTAVDGIYVLDSEEQFEFVNDAYLSITGYDRSELVGEHASIVASQETIDYATRIQESMSTSEGGPGIVEAEIETKNGDEVSVEARIVPFPPDSDDPGRIGILRDVTQRKRRERELERYETIVRTAGDPIYLLDAEGGFVDVNESMADLVGRCPEALVGDHVSSILGEDDLHRAATVVSEMVDGERTEATIDVDIHTDDGDRRLCSVSIAPLPFEDEFRGTVGVVRDVTDRHRRTQRLEVMDRILRHNLRNEMNIIRGRTEVLGDLVGEEGDEHVAEIIEGVNELLSLSEGARRFHEAFREGRGVRSHDLVLEVENAVEGFRERFPGASIRADLPDRAVARTHDAVRICVDELIENAILHHDRDDPTVEVSLAIDGEEVHLAVADDGPGIPPVDRRAFEGGRETSLEHASGLGLWLVSWIVTSSGGEVEFEDNDPRGMVVRLRFPSVDE